MATHYFKIENGAIVAGPTPKRGIRDPRTSLTGNEDDATLKRLGWLPQVKVGDVPATDTQVKTGPVHVVGANAVTSTWTIRNKTQAELDAELEERKEAEARAIDRALGKALFIHENRIRALEGLAPITAQQFRDWFKTQVT